MKNHRIEFKVVTTEGLVKRSTPWMPSLDECKNSRWMKEIEAVIIVRNEK